MKFPLPLFIPRRNGASFGALFAGGALFLAVCLSAQAQGPAPQASQPTQADLDEANAPKDVKIHLPRPVAAITPIKPARFEKRGDAYFCDFGADRFGNLQITFPGPVPAGTLTIRLGEKLNGNEIDRTPPGSINYCELTIATQAGKAVYQPEIPLRKGYQSHKTSIRMPAEIGNITPFRYAEIAGSPVPLDESAVRQMSAQTAFDDSASIFQSSDDTLNAVWELCKHTMKATTAFGVYIDGDRERRPYEADAYINFLSHLAVDANPEVGRYSVEYLLAHPTWPTEWNFHMPMMAVAEYEATGDRGLAERNYEWLKRRLLMDKAREEDGLIQAKGIIDWPSGERDGCDGNLQVSTVVNAFYYRGLRDMAVLARALQKDADAALLEARAKQVAEVVNAKLFDEERGIYLDGEGSRHASLHANMFPLAFDLVPADRQKRVVDFVQSRGLACSVYGAQYLLEALYKAGRDDEALKLMASQEPRSWWNMIAAGSTLTMEAWDLKFKGNSTWNHPWGAVPGNIITRYLLGVRPLTPGYGEILIAPRPGTLKAVQAKVPTVRGPVLLKIRNEQRFHLEVEVPNGTTARVSLPVKAGVSARTVLIDSAPVEATPEPGALVVEGVKPGRHVFELP